MDTRAARPLGGCISGTSVQCTRGIARERRVLAVSTFRRPCRGRADPFHAVHGLRSRGLRRRSTRGYSPAPLRGVVRRRSTAPGA